MCCRKLILTAPLRHAHSALTNRTCAGRCWVSSLLAILFHSFITVRGASAAMLLQQGGRAALHAGTFWRGGRAGTHRRNAAAAVSLGSSTCWAIWDAASGRLRKPFSWYRRASARRATACMSLRVVAGRQRSEPAPALSTALRQHTPCICAQDLLQHPLRVQRRTLVPLGVGHGCQGES